MIPTTPFCLALLAAASAQASILSCPSADLHQASGSTESPGFSLQTRSGEFLQSSYTFLDGDVAIEFFFLDFHPDLQPPFDSYSHDLTGMLSDDGVAFVPGTPLEFDYTDSINGIERFGLNGVVTDYVTRFSMDLHFVYDGENWSSRGNWEYYSLPFDDFIACQNAVPEPSQTLSVVAGLCVIGLWVNRHRNAAAGTNPHHPR